MSPKEKAQQLYGKFYKIPLYIKTVKQCCHIAVDEILQNGLFTFEDKKYWEEVKQEIDKL
jgi:hypothetical protein